MNDKEMNPILRIKKRTWIGCLPLLLVGLSYGDARPAYSLPLFDEDDVLYCYEVRTGKLLNKSHENIDSLSRLVVTNNGQYVYTTEFKAALRRWDARNNKLDEVSSIRGQASSMFVSSDGRMIAIGGNHRDVALYDANKGERLMYFQTEASDFYVTNVWLLGNRLIFTTDAGVLKDGEIQR
jgi:WD40 repeat protein